MIWTIAVYISISFVILLILLIALKIYSRLTCGMCKSKARLDGKTVLITGCTAGIGLETALDLAARGARIVMGCRDIPKSEQLIKRIKSETGNENVVVHKLNLESFVSINAFSEIIHKTEPRLDILINNAGTFYLEEALSENGLDMVMQVNHFGPFLLTNLLLDLIKKSAPSRIIMVSSRGHRSSKLDVSILNKRYNFYSIFTRYGNSKMCNILMANFLARKLQAVGVACNSLHPGFVDTEITRSITGFFSFFMCLMFKICGKSPKEGAQTTIYLAVDEKLENITGEYFADCAISKVDSRTKDEALIQDVWEISEKMVKLQPHEKHY